MMRAGESCTSSIRHVVDQGPVQHTIRIVQSRSGQSMTDGLDCIVAKCIMDLMEHMKLECDNTRSTNGRVVFIEGQIGIKGYTKKLDIIEQCSECTCDINAGVVVE